MTEALTRADQERAEIYAASCARHNARLEAGLRKAWILYHEAQAERLESTAGALAREHRAKARELRKDG
jgi:hypothetical protein